MREAPDDASDGDGFRPPLCMELCPHHWNTPFLNLPLPIILHLVYAKYSKSEYFQHHVKEAPINYWLPVKNIVPKNGSPGIEVPDEIPV